MNAIRGLSCSLVIVDEAADDAAGGFDHVLRLPNGVIWAWNDPAPVTEIHVLPAGWREVGYTDLSDNPLPAGLTHRNVAVRQHPHNVAVRRHSPMSPYGVTLPMSPDGDSPAGRMLHEAAVETLALERRTPLRRTAISRGKPLEGGGPLRRASATPEPHTEHRKRRATMPRRQAGTGPTTETRALVFTRDQGRCVRCGIGNLGSSVTYNLQHRIGRGAGGRSGEIADYLNSPVNLILLCGSATTGCHGWVEANPALADESGWSVPSWADPATWPVLSLSTGRWYRLEPDGARYEIDYRLGPAHHYPGVRRLEERG